MYKYCSFKKTALYMQWQKAYQLHLNSSSIPIVAQNEIHSSKVIILDMLAIYMYSNTVAVIKWRFT